MEPNTKNDLDQKRSGLREYFHNLFDIRDDMMSYEDLRNMMEENTIIRGSNMWILIMAIFIASIGLNVNSTAVIIGAMLISPLMSGILTMGYSLATCDPTMLRKAFTRFGTQVIISLVTSSIYFALSPLTVPTSEMIARTSPTLWDVLIAFFGVIAGGIGYTRNKKSNVIPGVAIATALMPPLCTAGYGIATGQPRFILGAFYLFSINTLFIMLSAALVTKLMGVPAHQVTDSRRQIRIRRIITLITVITVIPSISIGGYQVYQTVMEQNLSNYIKNAFIFSDTQVVQSQIDVLNKNISVSLLGAQITDDMIQHLEQEMGNYNLNDYTLHLTQNKTDTSEETQSATIALQQQTINNLQDQLDQQEMKLDEMTEAQSAIQNYNKLAEQAPIIFTKLEECSCGIMWDRDGEFVYFSGISIEEWTADEQEVLENWLSTETGITRVKADIRLHESEQSQM